MPLPTLTPEQREQALAKAAEARKRRAELKGQLKSEKLSLRDVLNRQLGQTIFMSTHYLQEAESMCDRVAILEAAK